MLLHAELMYKLYTIFALQSTGFVQIDSLFLRYVVQRNNGRIFIIYNTIKNSHVLWQTSSGILLSKKGLQMADNKKH